MPLNWKGWAHLAVFVAVIIAGSFWIQNDVPPDERAMVGVIGVVAFVLPLLWLAMVKTEGGWRWRG